MAVPMKRATVDPGSRPLPVTNSDKCSICGNTVVASEKLLTDGRIYHKNCFINQGPSTDPVERSPKPLALAKPKVVTVNTKKAAPPSQPKTRDSDDSLPSPNSGNRTATKPRTTTSEDPLPSPKSEPEDELPSPPTKPTTNGPKKLKLAVTGKGESPLPPKPNQNDNPSSPTPVRNNANTNGNASSDRQNGTSSIKSTPPKENNSSSASKSNGNGPSTMRSKSPGPGSNRPISPAPSDKGRAKFADDVPETRTNGSASTRSKSPGPNRPITPSPLSSSSEKGRSKSSADQTEGNKPNGAVSRPKSPGPNAGRTNTPSTSSDKGRTASSADQTDTLPAKPKEAKPGLKIKKAAPVEPSSSTAKGTSSPSQNESRKPAPKKSVEVDEDEDDEDDFGGSTRDKSRGSMRMRGVSRTNAMKKSILDFKKSFQLGTKEKMQELNAIESEKRKKDEMKTIRKGYTVKPDSFPEIDLTITRRMRSLSVHHNNTKEARKTTTPIDTPDADSEIRTRAGAVIKDASSSSPKGGAKNGVNPASFQDQRIISASSLVRGGVVAEGNASELDKARAIASVQKRTIDAQNPESVDPNKDVFSKEKAIEGIINCTIPNVEYEVLALTWSYCMENFYLVNKLFNMYWLRSKDSRIKERVKKFMLTWLSESHTDFEDDRLMFLFIHWHSCLKASKKLEDNLFQEELSSLWVEVNKPKKPVTMNNLPEIREMNWKKLAKSTSKFKPDDLVEKTPLLFFACQLLLVDFAAFIQVNHHDLLKTHWDANSKSTLIEIRDDFNWGVHWVASEILSNRNTKNRTAVLSKYIQVSQIFLRIYNMNGAMKIYRALTLPCISRLKKTWASLSPADVDAWNRLADVLSFQGSFAQYQAHLKNAKGSRIPAFIILMEELEVIENRDVGNSIGSVDVDTLKSFAELVAYFEKYQHISFGIPRDANLANTLKGRPCLSFKSLNKISNEIEPPSDGEDLESFAWYFGNIPKVDAEQVLIMSESDCFMLRRQGESLAISVKNAGETTVIHKIIENGPNGYYTQGSGSSFATVADLVKNTPELFGYGVAFSPFARQYKRKAGLRTEFSVESFDQLSGQSSLQSRTNRFFSDDFYERVDREPSFFIMSQVDKAYEEGDLKWLLQMMKTGEVPFTQKFPDEQNILHLIASFCNNPRYVEAVMEGNQEKPLMDARDAHGWTPLHNACIFGHLKIVGALLQYGAEVNAWNGIGATPLHCLARVKNCAEEEYRSTLRLMLSLGANLLCRDSNNDTPLNKAAMLHNEAGMKFLLSQGAEVHARNKQGETPVTFGIMDNSPTLTEVLLKAYQKSKSQRYPPQEEEFVALSSGKFVTEFHDENTTIDDEVREWEKSSAREDRPFKALYADSEDTVTFMAKNPKNGVFAFSVTRHANHYRGLIRTKDGDEQIQLAVFCDSQGILNSCNELSPAIEWRVYDQARFIDVITDGERQLAGIHQHSVGLLHIGKNEFTPKEIFAAKERSNFRHFNEFLYFLKGSNSEMEFGEDKATLDIKFKRYPISFNICNMLRDPAAREATLNYPVLIVLAEGPSFDSSILAPYACNVILVVKPIVRPKSDPPTHYSLEVMMRNSATEFDPRVSTEGPFPQEEEFRKFLLAKLLSADKVATTGVALEKVVSSRAARLDIMYLECDTITKLDTKSLAEKAFNSSGKEDYLLAEELGSGATSVAYRATHKITRKQYCIKVVNKAELRTPQLQEQILGEVDLLKKMDHPNVVACHETFETLAHLYIVLELCIGGTLTSEVKANGVFSEAAAAKVMFQLLDVLKYLHCDMSISHRDLKPDNILFGDESKKSIRVVDFGFSKDTQQQVLKNTIGGTLDYIAPEVIGGAKYDYFQIDMWSAGCIAYYLLFGYPPFQNAKTMVEIITAITTGAYSFDSKRVKLTDEAKSFVKKLLTVDPNKRPSSTEALNDPWLLSHNPKS